VATSVLRLVRLNLVYNNCILCVGRGTCYGLQQIAAHSMDFENICRNLSCVHIPCVVQDSKRCVELVCSELCFRLDCVCCFGSNSPFAFPFRSYGVLVNLSSCALKYRLVRAITV
jgi:hypothetical protein